MKKVLSLVLVLILAMSVTLVASAEGMDPGTAIPAPGAGVSIPDLNDLFNAFAEFIKFESIMVYVNGIHEALGEFYIQLDGWLRALGVVINGVLSGIFAG